jgi:hypothetical protein
VNDGAWHHLLVEFTRAAPAQVTMYLDGVNADGASAGALPAAGVSIANSAQFLVGKGASGNYLAGDIEFLRIARASLAEAYTTVEELYDWQFAGPALADFRGVPPNGRRDSGPLEVAYTGENLPAIQPALTSVVVELGGNGGVRVPVLNAESCAWHKDGGAMTGGTNASLALLAAQSSDEGLYRLVVGNAAGAATSAPITVAVIPEPVGAALAAACVALLCRRG